jgi:hypothetical protein
MAEIQFAKRHIRNRFSAMVLPHVSEGLWSVYENAKTVCEKDRQTDQILKTFQNLLVFIPKWDESRLSAEVERIQLASGCNYLEELLTGVLITYLRAFASVQYADVHNNVEVEFERPPLPRFIHELYKEVARQSWQHAYLYKTYGVSLEQQARNRKEIGSILDTALDTTLDSFLPWKGIIDKYFKEPTHQEVEAEAEVEEKKPEQSVQFSEPEEESEPESESESESEDESEQEHAPLTLSEETIDLDVESLDEKPSESVELVPSDETLVLTM